MEPNSAQEFLALVRGLTQGSDPPPSASSSASPTNGEGDDEALEEEENMEALNEAVDWSTELASDFLNEAAFQVMDQWDDEGFAVVTLEQHTAFAESGKDATAHVPAREYLQRYQSSDPQAPAPVAAALDPASAGGEMQIQTTIEAHPYQQHLPQDEMEWLPTVSVDCFDAVYSQLQKTVEKNTLSNGPLTQTEAPEQTCEEHDPIHATDATPCALEEPPALPPSPPRPPPTVEGFSLAALNAASACVDQRIAGKYKKTFDPPKSKDPRPKNCGVPKHKSPGRAVVPSGPAAGGNGDDAARLGKAPTGAFLRAGAGVGGEIAGGGSCGGVVPSSAHSNVSRDQPPGASSAFPQQALSSNNGVQVRKESSAAQAPGLGTQTLAPPAQLTENQPGPNACVGQTPGRASLDRAQGVGAAGSDTNVDSRAAAGVSPAPPAALYLAADTEALLKAALPAKIRPMIGQEIHYSARLKTSKVPSVTRQRVLDRLVEKHLLARTHLPITASKAEKLAAFAQLASDSTARALQDASKREEELYSRSSTKGIYTNLAARAVAEPIPPAAQAPLVSPSATETSAPSNSAATPLPCTISDPSHACDAPVVSSVHGPNKSSAAIVRRGKHICCPTQRKFFRRAVGIRCRGGVPWGSDDEDDQGPEWLSPDETLFKIAPHTEFDPPPSRSPTESPSTAANFTANGLPTQTAHASSDAASKPSLISNSQETSQDVLSVPDLDKEPGAIKVSSTSTPALAVEASRPLGTPAHANNTETRLRASTDPECIKPGSHTQARGRTNDAASSAMDTAPSCAPTEPNRGRQLPAAQLLEDDMFSYIPATSSPKTGGGCARDPAEDKAQPGVEGGGLPAPRIGERLRPSLGRRGASERNGGGRDEGGALAGASVGAAALGAEAADASGSDSAMRGGGESKGVGVSHQPKGQSRRGARAGSTKSGAERSNQAGQEAAEAGSTPKRPKRGELELESFEEWTVASRIEGQVRKFIEDMIRPMVRAHVISSKSGERIVHRCTKKVLHHHANATSAAFMMMEESSVRRMVHKYVEQAASASS